MRVIRAEFMGLCFGVRDALEVARGIHDPTTVSIYGELVHNGTIQHELQSRGFEVVGENDRETAHLKNRVMITAHGISQKRLNVLQAQASEILDTTCPLVRRVHEAAQQLESEGRLIILIGRPHHVEVQGVVEDLQQCVVLSGPEQVLDWQKPALGVISQSTTPPEMVDRCLKAIFELNAKSDIRFVDTICRPTRQRQQALEALCQSTQKVVVVGGKHSNNTKQLAQRCRQLGCWAVQVESAYELEQDWFSDVDVVGLTAGTSTPEETIEQVAIALASFPRLHASTFEANSYSE